MSSKANLPLKIGAVGWNGYMCDTGSINYGKRITVYMDYDGTGSPTRTITPEGGGDAEHTYIWLLKKHFSEAESVFFKQGDRVTVYDPGSKYDGRSGTLTGNGKVGRGVYLKLDGDGYLYWGLTKNFKKEADEDKYELWRLSNYP